MFLAEFDGGENKLFMDTESIYQTLFVYRHLLSTFNYLAVFQVPIFQCIHL